MTQLRFRTAISGDGVDVIQDLGGWAAVYRLDPSSPRIASIRIEPGDGLVRAGRRPAEPTGDLRGRMIRLLAPGAALAAGLEALRAFGADPRLGGAASFLADWAGVDLPALIADLEARALAAQAPDRRRLALVATAARYIDALDRGDRRPVATVAAELGLRPIQVRDRLSFAREQGLLERSGGQGRAGGRLTPKARAILEGATA